MEKRSNILYNSHLTTAIRTLKFSTLLLWLLIIGLIGIALFWIFCLPLQKVFHETPRYTRNSHQTKRQNQVDDGEDISHDKQQLILEPLDFTLPYFEFYYASNCPECSKINTENQQEGFNNELIKYLQQDAPMNFPLLLYNCSDVDNFLPCQFVNSIPILIYKKNHNDVKGIMYKGPVKYKEIKQWIQTHL